MNVFPFWYVVVALSWPGCVHRPYSNWTATMLSKYCATQLLLPLLLLLVERQIENGNPSSRCFYFHQVLYTAHFDSVSRTFIVPHLVLLAFLVIIIYSGGTEAPRRWAAAIDGDDKREAPRRRAIFAPEKRGPGKYITKHRRHSNRAENGERLWKMKIHHFLTVAVPVFLPSLSLSLRLSGRKRTLLRIPPESGKPASDFDSSLLGGNFPLQEWWLRWKDTLHEYLIIISFLTNSIAVAKMLLTNWLRQKRREGGNNYNFQRHESYVWAWLSVPKSKESPPDENWRLNW